MSKIDRYIAAEVAVPTLLGLAVFTLVLLLGRIVKIVELVINKGVELNDMALLIGFLLPSFFSITVPLAFLLGILLGFTRLSADNEIVALKSSGVSLTRMLRPVLLLALVPVLVTAWSTLYAQPLANQAFRAKLYDIANRHADIGLQPAVFNDDFSGLVIYARDIAADGLMRNLFIADERRSDAYLTLFADSGRIITDDRDLTLQLELRNGSIHRRDDTQNEELYQLVRFGEYRIELPLGTEGSGAEGSRVKNNERTLAQLLSLSESAPEEEKRRSALAEFHQRLSLPLTPLLFAFIGIPLGVQSSRSGRSGGFVIALFVALFYFFLMTAARTLTEQGYLPVGPGMWLPDLLFLGGGVLIFRQSCQERNFFLLDWLQRLLETMREKFRRRTD